MNNHLRVPTTPEIYGSLLSQHLGDLHVFSTYTKVGVTEPERCEAFTVWGFKDSDWPFMGAESSWLEEPDTYKRLDEKHEYWLCSPLGEECDE